MRSIAFVILVIYLAGQGCCVKNVLFIHSVLSPSHHLWNSRLAKGLVNIGYNVTFLSIDSPKENIENLHYIVIENVFEGYMKKVAEVFGSEDFDVVKYAEESSNSKIFAALGMNFYCGMTCDAIMKSNSSGIDQILSYPNDFKFDLVINDFTCGSCLLPIVQKFNYPSLVSITPFLNPPYTDLIVGGHKYPAYVPHYLLNFPQIMSFYQRCYNLLINIIERLSFKYQLYPEIERITRERFKFDKMPPLLEIEQKTKLLLLNSDHSIDYPEPLQPNMILVGGLQISEPKELPADMKKFVESGKKGTVLMSLGTNILSNLLGNEILTSILKTFESLPDYNFIWKFESEPHELPIKPSKNVMVAKFLPQNDLLAHKNLKAFITHAGGLSTQESLWYGKPMIGIPFIADQYRSIDKLVGNGVAVKVEIAKLKVETFRASILTVLETSKYTDNAQKISKLFQDKPMKPLETAIWWIEYVLRNPDAPIYRSPTLDLGYLASHNYDIFLACIVLIHLTVFSIKRLLSKVFKKAKNENIKIKSN